MIVRKSPLGAGTDVEAVVGADQPEVVAIYVLVPDEHFEDALLRYLRSAG